MGDIDEFECKGTNIFLYVQILLHFDGRFSHTFSVIWHILSRKLACFRFGIWQINSCV